MSFYALMTGRSGDDHTALLIRIALDNPDVGRYRDAWVGERNGKTVLEIFTRNGGGNRECYCESDEEHDRGERGCLARVIKALQQHPQYLCDYDDDFDHTYATFVFSVPSGWEKIFELIRLGQDKQTHGGARMMELIDDLQNPAKRDDPEVKRMLEASKPLIERIQSVLGQ